MHFFHRFSAIVWPVSALFLLTLLLSGCVTQPPAPVEQLPPTTSTPPPVTEPLPQLPPPSSMEYPDAMLSTPKVRDYSWSDAVQPMIDSLIQANADNRGVLLVNIVNNNTNGSLPADKATGAIRDALTGNAIFRLVAADQLDAARQQLGLSTKDRLTTRSKALAIAHNTGAQYVLYTTASGNISSPLLQMQLLLVQTGEILWSASNHVQLQQSAATEASSAQ